LTGRVKAFRNTSCARSVMRSFYTSTRQPNMACRRRRLVRLSAAATEARRYTPRGASTGISSEAREGRV
jgi:ribosomal protein S12